MAIIHCLGVGLVGSYVAKKLSANGHQVHAHDLNPDNVFSEYPRIIIHKGDVLESSKDKNNFGEVDIIVNMLPGEIGHTVMKNICKYGFRIVDLSFSEISPNVLKEETIENKSTILWDVGIAPGLSNMFLSLAVEDMGHLEKGEITSKVLSECCMPKSSQYHVQYVNKNDVISLYREVKSKIPTKIKKIIYYLINPTFSYWVDKCVESFIEIIQHSSSFVNFNLIYSTLEFNLNSCNLEEQEYFP